MKTLVLLPVGSLRKARNEASLPLAPSLRPVTQGRCGWLVYLARAGGSTRQLSRGAAARRESCLTAVVARRFGLGHPGLADPVSMIRRDRDRIERAPDIAIARYGSGAGT